MTSLFADVVGSTGLGERLDPVEVKAVIGECVSRMCEAVEAYGGVVTGQMGDGIAAFFGLHGSREDDTVRAARAALEIQRTVAVFAREVEEAWRVPNLNVRVGINAGRAAIGPVGGQEETVVALGDPVNVAARLQAFAEPGTIVVGASVASALEGQFELAWLDSVAVKGRTQPVEVFSLLERSSVTDRATKGAFVGRRSELERALDAVNELRTGRGQVLTVVGEGGIGKSRFISEVNKHLASDVLWLEGSCDRLDQRLPYEPFGQALRSFLGVSGETSSIAVRTKFRAAVEELLGSTFDEHAAHLSRLLGVDVGGRSERRWEGLPADVLTLGLHRAYGEWLACLARRTPVILVIDNFCDVTEPAAALVSFLLDQLERIPLLLVLAMRPRPQTPGWMVRVEALANHPQRCCEVRLAALDDRSALSLVEDLDRRDVLTPADRQLVLERAEGNPLYVEQFVAAMTHGENSRAASLPRGLESFLLARIDSLTPHARLVAQGAAVVGRVFAEKTVRAMFEEGPFDESLSELLRADVVREYGRSPVRFRFCHGLVRDAALMTMTPERLRTMHASAAGVIQHAADFDVDRDGEALARHYLACGEDVLGIEYLETLGDRLAKVYRLDLAAGLYQRCVAACEEAGSPTVLTRIATKYAEVLALRGDTAGAVTVLERAMEKGPDGLEAIDLRLALAERLIDAERSDKARELLEAVVLDAADACRRERCLTLLGHIALDSLDLPAAKRCLRALRDTAQADNPQLSFEIASLEAGVHARTGELAEASRWAEAAAELAVRRVDQLTSQRRVALVAMLRGHVSAALTTLRDLYCEYAGLGDVLGQVDTAVNLLAVCAHAGEFRLGVKIATDVLSYSQDAPWRSAILPTLAELAVEQGDVTLGRRLAVEILDDPRPTVAWARSAAWSSLINAAVFEGGWDEARRIALSGRTELDVHGLPRDRAIFDLELAEIATAAGNLKEAAEWARRANGVEVTEVPISVQIDRALGTALALLGDEEGRDRLRAALARARKCGMRIEEARCLVGLSVSAPDEGGEELALARQIFRDCGSLLGLKYADALEAVAAKVVLA